MNIIYIYIYIYIYIEDARDVIVIVVGRDPGTGDVIVCISHWPNTIGRGMNPTILPTAIRK